MLKYLIYTAPLYMCLFGMIFTIKDLRKEAVSLRDTIDYLSNPDLMEKVVIIDENLKSRQDRIRIKIEDLIEEYNYPKYMSYDDLQNLSRIIEKYSKRYDVPVDLVISVIHTESAFNPQATSPVGAVGLMQVMPSTAEVLAKSLSVKEYELYSVDTNVRFGTFYLKQLLKEFDIEHSVRAYNAGPQNVKRGIDNGKYPGETILYHIKVMEVYNSLVSKKYLYCQGEN